MSAIPANYRLVKGLSFEYCGMDSRCPKCGGPVAWYKLRCDVIACETCEILCVVSIEQVWQVPQPTPEYRKPEVIVGRIRENIDAFIRTVGRTHGYGRLDELCSELEAAMRQEVSK